MLFGGGGAQSVALSYCMMVIFISEIFEHSGIYIFKLNIFMHYLKLSLHGSCAVLTL
jgi:hypothetical protein